MSEKAKKTPRSSTLEVLERMLGLASQLGIGIHDIEVSAVALFMQGNNINQVASLLGVDRSSADDLIWRGVYELQRLENALANVVYENKQLKEINALLSEENQLMREKIGGIEADIVISQYRLKKKIKEKGIDEKLLERLSLSIYQLGISSRICRCLRAGDIFTLGDIVKHNRSYFLRFRNLGVKALAEIDKAVADAGLTYEFVL